MSIEAQFCDSVNNALQGRNGAQIQSILVLEPPFAPIYQQLIKSLQSSYPANNAKSEERLENIIRNGVPETGEGEDEDGRPVPGWGQMVSFLACWMAFIRDVNVENLLETYERLSDLQTKANSALQHPTKGILVLPTVIAYAKVLSRVAIGLDKHPELIAHLTYTSASEGGPRESMPEKAANTIRNAFITCLNDRNTAPGGVKDGKPDGKKIGIYKTANICLKILFQCSKLDNCEMIFKNIQNSSPPLHIYPASERVTYLYYLGRFQFAYGEFYKAQLCLQKAYDECPAFDTCIPQRRLILIYLLISNLLLGRFPHSTLYTRPEARGLRAKFEPLTTSIRTGDLETFKRLTALDLSWKHAPWFYHHRAFYQLGNYCLVYVWRSLFRNVFLLTGSQGATSRSAPTLDLHAVQAAFSYYERRLRMPPALAASDHGPGKRHFSLLLSDFTPSKTSGYVDPDFEGLDDVRPWWHETDLKEVECVCGSLIMNGFLNGFVSHKGMRFAILGSRKSGMTALTAGFPVVWRVIRERSEERVVGWKLEGGDGGGGGGVVRLAGARPAGS